MTAEKPETPLPPDGFATWLDYVLRPAQSPFLQVSTLAAAELAALRQALADRSADLAVCLNDLESVAKERDEYRFDFEEISRLGQETSNSQIETLITRTRERGEAMKKLSDTEGWLATARQQALDLDAMRAEAVRERDEARDHLKTSWSDCVATARERDEARAKLAELRAEALALGEITPHDAMWFADSLRYACWNALVAKLRAEQGGEVGKS